jgi:hypothetical protein
MKEEDEKTEKLCLIRGLQRLLWRTKIQEYLKIENDKVNINMQIWKLEK